MASLDGKNHEWATPEFRIDDIPPIIDHNAGEYLRSLFRNLFTIEAH